MPPSALKNKGYIALFLTSTLWGTTWVVSKVGIREIPALQLTAIRQFVAGLCFVLFFMVVKKYPLPNRYQLRRMFIVCLFMFVAANGLSTWGLNYIPTGLGALIGALYPLSVVLIERIFYKGRKILPLTLVGFLLGVTGMVIVFYENIRLTGNSLFLFGLALSVIAMLSWSLGTIFVTRKTFTINPYYGIGWQMLMSSVV
nr:DMT family transporter [Ferruginibacter sp.]